MAADSESRPISTSARGGVLVAGACGFVGANLCRYFAERGVEVWAVDGPSGKDWRLQQVEGIHRVKIDLSSRDEVHAFIEREAPSVVINCAAYGAYASQSDPDRIYQVNFHAVQYMLEAVRKLPHFTAFIQAGSSSEYGLNCSAPTERSPTLPDSDYAVSKVAATSLCQLYGLKHKVPAWSLRFYSVYGPYEDFSRLIPQLLLHARKGAFPKLVDPTISRDFIYVNDVCQAVERLLERASHLRRGEIFNIGTGSKTTLGELVSLVKSTFDVPSEPVWGSMANRHWDHPDWYSDASKAKQDLAWSATTSLRDGLRATMRWIDANPDAVLEGQKSSVLTSSRA
jgi:dolichol-phosphate mannosyltransferase